MDGFLIFPTVFNKSFGQLWIRSLDLTWLDKDSEQNDRQRSSGPFQIVSRHRCVFRPSYKLVQHGSLNVPIEHHPTLGIWSIMATIRWCPIYPKWDSYQPLYKRVQSSKESHQIPNALSDHRGAWAPESLFLQGSPQFDLAVKTTLVISQHPSSSLSFWLQLTPVLKICSIHLNINWFVLLFLILLEEWVCMLCVW